MSGKPPRAYPPPSLLRNDTELVTIVTWTGLDCDGGVATGLHDARVLLPGGVHHHPEEECQTQQISGENQKRTKLSSALFQRGKMGDPS